MDAVTGTYVIGAPEGQKLTDPANRAAIEAFIAKLNDLSIVDHEKKLTSPVAATEEMGCLAAPDPSKCSSAPLNVLRCRHRRRRRARCRSHR